jgi:uncharacterized protein YdaU (DUF1376 family)
MGLIKWYKRDPRAALAGMRGLTLEERGAYNTILDLIYVNDGALEDSPREICHELHCNAQRWRRIKARLLELGKIYIHGGCIHNERADEEIQSYKKVLTILKVSAKKRWVTYNEIKALGDAHPILTTPRLVSKLSARTVPTQKTTDKKKDE